MLRLFKQYYPVRNAIFVVGEGLFIFFSVVSPAGSSSATISFCLQTMKLIFKTLLIAAVCQMCLYYNDCMSEGAMTLSMYASSAVSGIGCVCRSFWRLSLPFSHLYHRHKCFFNEHCLCGRLCCDLAGEVHACFESWLVRSKMVLLGQVIAQKMYSMRLPKIETADIKLRQPSIVVRIRPNCVQHTLNTIR